VFVFWLVACGVTERVEGELGGDAAFGDGGALDVEGTVADAGRDAGLLEPSRDAGLADASPPRAPEPSPELDSSSACRSTAPLRPSIVSPEDDAKDLRRGDLTVVASTFSDEDGHELLAAEFEIREFTGASDPTLVWSGRSAATEMNLAEGTFVRADTTTLDFERRYTLSVRFEDSGDCNTISEWSLPVVFTTSDGSDELFDPEVVRIIEISIPTDNGSPSSWESIEQEAQVDGCFPARRNYYEGSVAFEGTFYEGVGIRTKGGCGSSRSLYEKASFKLKLDWDRDTSDGTCPENRKLLGRSTLTLNAGVQDPSAMREHLTYRYFREAGVPAPRTAAIQVYVNGEYYGLYQNVESIDRRFVRRHFDESAGKGMMYEGAYWCDFFSGDDSAYEDGHCWDREFALGECDDAPGALDDLQLFEADGTTPQDPWQFISNLHTALEAIAAPESYFPQVDDVLDWGSFLSYWATGAVVVDWDNYVYNQNNFRIYHHPASGKWHFLPWGVDQTWEPDGRGDFSPLDVRGDVARLCLESTGALDGASCTDQLLARLGVALAQFEGTGWPSAIDEWQARLDPYMQLDGDRKSYDYYGWLEAVDALRDFAAGRADTLREQLANDTDVTR
jgi:spore coat protein CotH